MIIAFGLGLVGALLILANNKYLRILRISVVAFILACGLGALGIYFIINSQKGTDGTLFFPLLTPLTALILMHFTRLLFKKYKKKEIILHIHGLFPLRHEERYVTRPEINITFIILALSILIPFIILKIVI
jgi:hypothetical protein